MQWDPAIFSRHFSGCHVPQFRKLRARLLRRVRKRADLYARLYVDHCMYSHCIATFSTKVIGFPYINKK